MEMRKDCDLLILGSGIVPKIIAYRMNELHPELRITLLDKNPNKPVHRAWSFFRTDLRPEQVEWVRPLVSESWEGYDVVFPKLNRTIWNPYYCIGSQDVFPKFEARFKNSNVHVYPGLEIESLHSQGVSLRGGKTIHARWVLDSRDCEDEITRNAVGYQKITAMTFRLKRLHGLRHPILMDARLDQKDGYRYSLCLPLNERVILLEDICWSESSFLDLSNAESQIQDQILRNWGEVEEVLGRDQRLLAVPDGHEEMVPEMFARVFAVGRAGGFFHSSTGNEFPDAVRLADQLARHPDILAELDAEMTKYSQKHRERNRFFHLFNRMLFKACNPEHRFKVFERLYSLDEEIIARFFAARLKRLDEVRILSSRPPVSVSRAWSELTSPTA